jgi:hypothetical protein
MWCVDFLLVLSTDSEIFWKEVPQRVIVPYDDVLDVEVSRVLPPGYEVGIWGSSTSNSKYVPSPIVHEYREGKFKRTLNRE